MYINICSHFLWNKQIAFSIFERYKDGEKQTWTGDSIGSACVGLASLRGDWEELIKAVPVVLPGSKFEIWLRNFLQRSPGHEAMTQHWNLSKIKMVNTPRFQTKFELQWIIYW